MFFKTFAHAFVVLSVAILWSSQESPEKPKTFEILGIAGSAAVEEVQAQPLTFVASAEDHGGGKHTIDWCVLELEEASVSL